MTPSGKLLRKLDCYEDVEERLQRMKLLVRLMDEHLYRCEVVSRELAAQEFWSNVHVSVSVLAVLCVLTFMCGWYLVEYD